jgi:glucosyl-dolichyl phosphate glucuronosyltransferase
MTIQISAIICTFNRAKYLRKAIPSLVSQTIDAARYEILVIDNCSSDDTKQIVTQEFANVPNLRYLYEPVQGLSQARNTGWQNAKGDYVAYLDDDAIASPHWLEKIVEVFETTTPQPGMVGGKIEPIWESPMPEWLSKNTAVYLALLDWSESPITSTDRQLLAGANVSFPKQLLEKFGGFDVNLGRKANKLLSNEEILLWHQMRTHGYCCLYHPEVAVCHHIQASRLNQNWFIRRLYWEGVSDALLKVHLESLSLKQRWQLGTKSMQALLRSRKELINLTKTASDRKSFDRQCSTWSKIGYILGAWGIAR